MLCSFYVWILFLSLLDPNMCVCVVRKFFAFRFESISQSFDHRVFHCLFVFPDDSTDSGNRLSTVRPLFSKRRIQFGYIFWLISNHPKLLISSIIRRPVLSCRSVFVRSDRFVFHLLFLYLQLFFLSMRSCLHFQFDSQMHISHSTHSVNFGCAFVRVCVCLVAQ